uniref:Uncharacterized protein n=1 Tax=Myoviridae sp. ctRci5 TaxID=2825105 RepID=A0A8S5V6E4_9CAUD|nr:MAG TPA: hypothetical protein [Myoviridae sp. ctRci5]
MPAQYPWRGHKERNRACATSAPFGNGRLAVLPNFGHLRRR